MTFEQLVSEKENWIGGKFRTSESGDSGYKNMTITNMEIKNEGFYLYSGQAMVSTTIINNRPIINSRGDEVTFHIPYIGCCTMIRNKGGI